MRLLDMPVKQQELDHAQIFEQGAQVCCLSVPFRYLCPSFSCICAGLIYQKLFLQCILKGDGKYPSSVVPDFRSQDWTVMY